MNVNDILRIFRKWILLIILLPLVALMASAFYNYQIATVEYTSYADILVFHQQNDETLTGGDLTTSDKVINDFIYIAGTSPIRLEAANRMNVTVGALNACQITVTKQTDTRVVRIQVVSSQPEFAEKAVQAITTVSVEYAKEYLQTENIRTIEPACAGYRSGPNSLRNTLLGGVMGLAAAIAIALLVEMLNTTIRTAEDVEKLLQLPVLAKIPRFDK